MYVPRVFPGVVSCKMFIQSVQKVRMLFHSWLSCLCPSELWSDGFFLLGHILRKWTQGKSITEIHLMVCSRFGEVCSCCCLPALPGLALPGTFLTCFAHHFVHLCTLLVASRHLAYYFIQFQVTGSATAATAAAPPARTALAVIASAVTAARSKWRRRGRPSSTVAMHAK